LIAKVRKEFFFFKCGNYSSHGTRSDRGFWLTGGFDFVSSEDLVKGALFPFCIICK
jgi:hypothetical protein